MVILSIKSVPGITFSNQIAGIMTEFFSGCGMASTQSPQMVIVITSIMVEKVVVQTVDSDQLEYITHAVLSQNLQAYLNHQCVTMSSK